MLTAAIVHWNTVYLDRAIQALRAQGVHLPDDLMAHVAPLGWEHIALTGDYIWANANPAVSFLPLRDARFPFQARAAKRAVSNKSCGDPMMPAATCSPTSKATTTGNASTPPSGISPLSRQSDEQAESVST